MRKIILTMQMSLDGFVEGPQRDISWHRVDDELHRHFNDELRTMGAFLSGRATYELMAASWPTAAKDPSSTAPMVEYAAIGTCPKSCTQRRWKGRAGIPPWCAASSSRTSGRSRNNPAATWGWRCCVTRVGRTGRRQEQPVSGVDKGDAAGGGQPGRPTNCRTTFAAGGAAAELGNRLGRARIGENRRPPP